MSIAASWYRASCALLLLTLYFSCFLSILPLFLPLSLSLSLSLSLCLSLPLSLSLPPFLSIYVSLWLQDTCHMMPFTKQHSAYAWVVTCILFLNNLTFHNLSLHSSYKIHQPFTDYVLRLPYSELLEKRLFRSRANCRLVCMLSGRSSADRGTGAEMPDWHKQFSESIRLINALKLD